MALEAFKFNTANDAEIQSHKVRVQISASTSNKRRGRLFKLDPCGPV